MVRRGAEGGTFRIASAPRIGGVGFEGIVGFRRQAVHGLGEQSCRFSEGLEFGDSGSPAPWVRVGGREGINDSTLRYYRAVIAEDVPSQRGSDSTDAGAGWSIQGLGPAFRHICEETASQQGKGSAQTLWDGEGPVLEAEVGKKNHDLITARTGRGRGISGKSVHRNANMTD